MVKKRRIYEKLLALWHHVHASLVVSDSCFYKASFDIWLSSVKTSCPGCRLRNYLLTYMEMLHIGEDLVRLPGYFTFEAWWFDICKLICFPFLLVSPPTFSKKICIEPLRWSSLSSPNEADWPGSTLDNGNFGLWEENFSRNCVSVLASGVP